MMKLASIFLLTFLLSAQNAEVTILQPADAKEAASAYRELKAAEQKWSELTARLKRVYGVQYEAEFSKDFAAMVPKYSGLTGGTGMISTWPCNGTWAPVAVPADVQHWNKASNLVAQ